MNFVKLFYSQPGLPQSVEAQTWSCLNQMRQQEPPEQEKPLKALLLISLTAEPAVGVDVNLMSTH